MVPFAFNTNPVGILITESETFEAVTGVVPIRSFTNTVDVVPPVALLTGVDTKVSSLAIIVLSKIVPIPIAVTLVVVPAITVTVTVKFSEPSIKESTVVGTFTVTDVCPAGIVTVVLTVV